MRRYICCYDKKSNTERARGERLHLYHRHADVYQFKDYKAGRERRRAYANRVYFALHALGGGDGILLRLYTAQTIYRWGEERRWRTFREDDRFVRSNHRHSLPVRAYLGLHLTIIIFYKISRTAAWLLAPYFLWVSFALYSESWRTSAVGARIITGYFRLRRCRKQILEF
jgi:hypothetical protein